MNRDLQGLWIARLARDPLLVSGLLLPVWCVGARTRFLMTHCTIPTLVNVFAGNLFIRLVSKVFMEWKLYMGMVNVYGSSCRHTGTQFAWMSEAHWSFFVLIVTEYCHALKNDFLQLKEECYVELSTYIYIDCLSLFTCSIYYSMRG